MARRNSPEADFDRRLLLAAGAGEGSGVWGLGELGGLVGYLVREMWICRWRTPVRYRNSDRMPSKRICLAWESWLGSYGDGEVRATRG